MDEEALLATDTSLPRWCSTDRQLGRYHSSSRPIIINTIPIVVDVGVCAVAAAVIVFLFVVILLLLLSRSPKAKFTIQAQLPFLMSWCLEVSFLDATSQTDAIFNLVVLPRHIWKRNISHQLQPEFLFNFLSLMHSMLNKVKKKKKKKKKEKKKETIFSLSVLLSDIRVFPSGAQFSKKGTF